MEENKIENLNQLIEDIQLIKSSVKKNTVNLKEVIYSPSVQITTLFAGIMIIVFSFVYYNLITKYGGYENIPVNYRTMIFWGVIVSSVIATILKMTFYKILKEKYPYDSFIGLTLKLWDIQVLLGYFFVLGIMIYLSVYFGITGKPQYIVPVVDIGVGICFLLMPGFLYLFEVFSLGTWLIITGLLCLPFIEFTPKNSLLWLAFSSGAGYILFTVISQINRLFKK